MVGFGLYYGYKVKGTTKGGEQKTLKKVKKVLDKRSKRCYNKGTKNGTEKEKRTMTKGNAIRYYRKFSGAQGYIIGFTYKKKSYMAIVDEIMPRFIRVEKEASKKGGKEKLQLRLTNQHMEQLIRKGAIEIDYEVTKGNNGRNFEMWVQRYFGQVARDWDNDGFWVGGDVNVDGIEYQIKFNGAQIVTFDTLHNLQKCGKDFKNYKPKVGRKKKVA